MKSKLLEANEKYAILNSLTVEIFFIKEESKLLSQHQRFANQACSRTLRGASDDFLSFLSAVLVAKFCRVATSAPLKLVLGKSQILNTMLGNRIP